MCCRLQVAPSGESYEGKHRLGRKQWHTTARYIWRDSLHVTCGLTVCTPGSAPGPTLGNEYGKTLPFLLCGRGSGPHQRDGVRGTRRDNPPRVQRVRQVRPSTRPALAARRPPDPVRSQPIRSPIRSRSLSDLDLRCSISDPATRRVTESTRCRSVRISSVQFRGCELPDPDRSQPIQ